MVKIMARTVIIRMVNEKYFCTANFPIKTENKKYGVLL
jgi:hypothetical protein